MKAEMTKELAISQTYSSAYIYKRLVNFEESTYHESTKLIMKHYYQKYKNNPLGTITCIWNAL